MQNTTHKIVLKIIAFMGTSKSNQVFDSFALPSACLCHHRTDFAYNRHFGKLALIHQAYKQEKGYENFISGTILGSRAMEDPLSNLKCSLAEELDLGKSQQTQGYFMIRRYNAIFIACPFLQMLKTCICHNWCQNTQVAKATTVKMFW